ncbi:MAG: ABC-F family ATP-binding cassette domain-containing protein [Bacteroidales bacterium]|nr:ABC-F family ATP-binding cassette domain-containing protein [Bacteroidales bacterium]
MAEALLTVENLTKSYGDKLLFDNISFGINSGQKSALIARNGYGKSTLLNIIVGNTLPDNGKVTFSTDCRLAYMPQTVGNIDNRRVRDYVFDVKRRENEDEWLFEQRVEEVVSRMKLAALLDRSIDSLSGGEQKKMALCHMLVDDCNLLILDEPTNHLDIEMIEWLEDYLSRQRLAILMVTHDRYFLDSVCDNIFELDNARLYHYRGKYEYYLEKKAEREANERAEVEKAKSLYRTELEWMRRMPQARGTKSQARKDAFYELQAKARTKFEEKESQFTVKTERIGGKVMDIFNLTYSYGGTPIVTDFSYSFKRQDRVGIVGANGVGKSTLLGLITGSLHPTSGHIEVGQTIRIGYYSQKGMMVADDRRVIDIVREVAEQIEVDGGRTMSAHQFLSYFGFDSTTQYNYFANLSGGERRKLYLLMVLIANPNFLILDEPTNDLDIRTLQTLEQFLIAYKGCLIIVSHDRSFLDHTVDHLFVFEGEGKVRDYPFTYSSYRECRKAQIDADRQEKKRERELVQPTIRQKNKPAQRATYKQRQEYDALSVEIEQLNVERQKLEDALSDGTLTLASQLQEASVRIGQIIQELDEKEMRWLELDELIN